MNEIPETWLRILLAGPVGSGKSHQALSMPLPVVVLYSDRMGGDADLLGLESAGVHVWRIDRFDPRGSMLKMIGKLQNGGLKAMGVKSVVWDTPTYTINHAKSQETNHNRNGMQLHQNKKVAFDILDVCDALFELEANILILSHIKEEVVKDKKTKEVVSRVWVPDMMGSTVKAISRECALMGYTWKKVDGDGKPNRYGICFAQNMRDKNGRVVMEFRDVKAPNGWGSNEPANVRLLIERLKQEAATRRQAALEALHVDVDLSKDLPEETPTEEALKGAPGNPTEASNEPSPMEQG